MNNIFNVLNGEKSPPRILWSVKTSFKTKDEIKTFSDTQKPQEFIPSRPGVTITTPLCRWETEAPGTATVLSMLEEGAQCFPHFSGVWNGVRKISYSSALNPILQQQDWARETSVLTEVWPCSPAPHAGRISEVLGVLGRPPRIPWVVLPSDSWYSPNQFSQPIL